MTPLQLKNLAIKILNEHNISESTLIDNNDEFVELIKILNEKRKKLISKYFDNFNYIKG